MIKSLRFFVVCLAASLAGFACAANSSRGEVICASLADKNLPPETLATVDGQPITLQQLEKAISGRAKGAFLKAKTSFFDAKKKALDDYLFEKLLEKEAKAQKKTAAELTESEVTKKTKKITDKDIQAFYDKIKKQREGFGQKIPPLEKRIADQIRKNLEMEKARTRKDAYFAELRSKHKVAYLLDAPRLTIEVGSNPPQGNKNAPVTLVEFSDFQCPYCKRASETVNKVVKSYPGKVKRYFRDFPLGFHKKAKSAAMAARCAGEQGKFWQYHDKLFSKQELEPKQLSAHAKELKLDVAKFDKCVKSNKYNADIAKDMQAGAEVGVSGTPAFFINGKMLSGALPAEAFKKVIDQELARLQK